MIVHWVLQKVGWASVNSFGYGIPLRLNENGNDIQSFVKEGIYLYCSFVFSIAAVSHPIIYLFRFSSIDSYFRKQLTLERINFKGTSRGIRAVLYGLVGRRRTNKSVGFWDRSLMLGI
jgi:hypothetical protein